MGLLSLEKQRFVRGLINVYKYLEGGCKEDGAGLFSVVPSARTRGKGHKLKHRRVPLNTRKHFYCEGDQALTQASQRGGGVSHLGDSQKPSGYSPGVYMARKVGTDGLQKSLLTLITGLASSGRHYLY